MSARWIEPMVLIASLVIGTTACDGEEDDVTRAAAVAKAIRAAPDETEAILDEHDMTIEDFEQLMYDIAADPEMSEKYEEAISSDE